MERGAGFDGQLIDGKVPGLLGQRLGQFGAPGARFLAGPRGDQIEGPARKIRARDLEGGQRLGGAVLAAEEGERGVVERLDAEGNPVDPGPAVGGETPGLDRARVGFEGDLGFRRQPPGFADPRDDRDHGFGLLRAGQVAAPADFQRGRDDSGAHG